MKLYCPITIDLYRVYPLQVMEAQQGNVGRGAMVTLTAGSAVIDPKDENVEVYAKTPDGTVSWLECSVEDGKIKIDFTNQMLMSPGILQVELRMKDDEDDITTPIFKVKVNKSNVQSAARSENELPLLDQIKKNAEDAKAAVGKLSEEIGELGGVVDYVVNGAEEVANKVLAVRNAYSFVSGNVSDLHTDGTGQTSISILHAGQAMNEIQKRTQLDLLAIHGDIMPYRFEDRYKTGFPYVKKCFSEVTKAIPFIQMQGNHDELSTDTTDVARQKYFAYIGANNVCTVTDWENRFRNYGYKDFESQKKRIIYLNTADVSESEVTNDAYVSANQLLWLVNTALDFSDKEDDAENWTVSVYGHHCLDWYGNISNVLKFLDAYKGKTSGSITLDGVTIPYDFTNATVKFIAYYHGHLHNFRVKRLGTNGILDITIPNACFNRNNEYGTSSSYDENVHNNYGDVDSNGNQRQFNKTANTVNDTAFNIIIEDMLNEKIHCFNYGSGIDREIPFVEEVVEETKYTIIRNLTNCTSSSLLTEIVEGGSHSETLSADSGYTMDGATVTVTMGGDDISSSYSNEVLNISNVTGDIVISASAVKEETGGGDTPSYTNQIPISTDIDGSVFNGTGYKTGYRFNSSGGETAIDGYALTGFIPAKANDVVRMSKGLWTTNGVQASYQMIKLYDESKTALTTGYISYQDISVNGGLADFSEGDITQFTIASGTGTTSAITAVIPNTAYIRLAVAESGLDGGVITINEEITEGGV